MSVLKDKRVFVFFFSRYSLVGRRVRKAIVGVDGVSVACRVRIREAGILVEGWSSMGLFGVVGGRMRGS